MIEMCASKIGTILEICSLVVSKPGSRKGMIWIHPPIFSEKIMTLCSAKRGLIHFTFKIGEKGRFCACHHLHERYWMKRIYYLVQVSYFPFSYGPKISFLRLQIASTYKLISKYNFKNIDTIYFVITNNRYMLFL